MRYRSLPTTASKMMSAELRCSTSSTKCQMNNEATRSSPGRKSAASLSSMSLKTGVKVASRSAVYARRYSGEVSAVSLSKAPMTSSSVSCNSG